MTRKTKQSLQADNERLQRENTVLLVAMNALDHETPQADETACEGDAPEHRYRFRLFRADGPHGGIVVTTFSAPGQAPLTSASYLDDLRDAYRLDVPLRIAIERLVLSRDRILRDENSR